MGKVIVITSGKGGVGKTTVVANLGVKLAQSGKRVVLLDVDVGLNNLDVITGIENKVVYDFVDVIENRCRISQALIVHDRYKNLFIMPSCHKYDETVITGQNLKIVANRLKEMFDYCLIDCPAGIELGFHRAVSACDDAIVVTTPHISSVKDASRVLSTLRTYNILTPRLIINRLRGDLIVSGDMMNIAEITELLKVKLLGVVPEDDYVNALSYGGVLTDERSWANNAFLLLAQNLISNDHRIFDCTSKYQGLFGAIRRNIKRRV